MVKQIEGVSYGPIGEGRPIGSDSYAIGFFSNGSPEESRQVEIAVSFDSRTTAEKWLEGLVDILLPYIESGDRGVRSGDAEDDTPAAKHARAVVSGSESLAEPEDLTAETEDVSFERFLNSDSHQLPDIDIETTDDSEVTALPEGVEVGVEGLETALEEPVEEEVDENAADALAMFLDEAEAEDERVKEASLDTEFSISEELDDVKETNDIEEIELPSLPFDLPGSITDEELEREEEEIEDASFPRFDFDVEGDSTEPALSTPVFDEFSETEITVEDVVDDITDEEAVIALEADSNTPPVIGVEEVDGIEFPSFDLPEVEEAVEVDLPEVEAIEVPVPANSIFVEEDDSKGQVFAGLVSAGEEGEINREVEMPPSFEPQEREQSEGNIFQKFSDYISGNDEKSKED